MVRWECSHCKFAKIIKPFASAQFSLKTKVKHRCNKCNHLSKDYPGFRRLNEIEVKYINNYILPKFKEELKIILLLRRINYLRACNEASIKLSKELKEPKSMRMNLYRNCEKYDNLFNWAQNSDNSEKMMKELFVDLENIAMWEQEIQDHAESIISKKLRTIFKVSQLFNLIRSYSNILKSDEIFEGDFFEV